jgi:hypothetical protein
VAAVRRTRAPRTRNERRAQDEREFAVRWGIADLSDGTFGYVGYFRAAAVA